ncbi:MAG: hypothetical protein LBG19_00505 [Prevotellaceae bacterium]|jgi:hypothetical protein|nr:hypothetical protein [Prevotellaceae bacterium]
MIANSEFNQRLLAKIGETYPRKSQQLEFLMDKMSLGKESAYRRLRGDVPFSFTEACIVSQKLGLSLDDIVKNTIKNENPSFFLHVPPPSETLDDYLHYYKHTYAIYDVFLDKWANDPELKIYFASNIVPQAFMFPYHYLSKFRAFAWKYQMHHNIAPAKFSAINMPDDIYAKQQILLQKIRQFPECTYIISRNIFDNLVKMIQYFFDLSLLTREEVITLRDELLQLLSKLEILTTQESLEHNRKILVYLANIDFDSNYTYIQGSKYERSFIELYFINTISSSDSQLCRIQKEWIESLKKYSTMISMSGNIERIAFFDRQRELVNSLNF